MPEGDLHLTCQQLETALRCTSPKLLPDDRQLPQGGNIQITVEDGEIVISTEPAP
jgi:hypothetical protein